MLQILLVTTILLSTHCFQANENWNKAYNTAMSIKPGAPQDEVDDMFDTIIHHLSESKKESKNKLLPNSNFINTDHAVKEADAIENEQRLLMQDIERVKQIKNPNQRDRELEKLSLRREELRQRKIEWEKKNGYNNQVAQPQNNNQTNTNQTYHNSPSSAEPVTKVYYSSSDRSENKPTDAGLINKDVFNKMREDASPTKRWFPKNISVRNAIILGTISAGGWITYRSTNRIADYCSTIDNRKLLKTCFYVGAGSAVLVASLYGYKKLMRNKTQSNTPPQKTSKKTSTVDYASLSHDELRALTRENEQKIADMSARQKIAQQASDKRTRGVKKRADQVDNQLDTSGIVSDLGDALIDVASDPLTPASELMDDAQHAINGVKKTLTKKWNQFKNWLHS